MLNHAKERIERMVPIKLTGFDLYLRQLEAAALSKPSQEGLHPSSGKKKKKKSMLNPHIF